MKRLIVAGLCVAAVAGYAYFAYRLSPMPYIRHGGSKQNPA